MDDTALRELFDATDLGPEPPIGALVTDALGTGRRRRRQRRIAGISGSVAAVVAIAVAVPLVVGSVHRSAPEAQPATIRTAPAPTLPPGVTLPLPVPTIGTATVSGDQVATTPKALAQLLIDSLPAGYRVLNRTVSSVDSTPTNRASALVEVEVNGKIDTISVDLSPPHASQIAPCSDPSNAADTVCQDFTLGGGVTAQETISPTASASSTNAYVSHVTIRRANGVTVDVLASNYDFTESQAVGAGPIALTLNQLATIAGDPRWGWTMDRSFVQHAAGLDILGGVDG